MKNLVIILKALLVYIFINCILNNCVIAEEQTSDKQSIYNISAEKEQELGIKSSKYIISKYGILKDKEINAYVNKVGQKIVSNISKKRYEYNFIVLDTTEVNAYALPGGFVFITKGALQAMSTEDELAGVLAHEIAHIENFHVLKFLED
jgi:predicted Zn-dependent protease